MSFLSEINEILADTADSESLAQAMESIESAHPEERAAITYRIEQLVKPARFALPEFLRDEFHALVTAVFTFGVLIGREHRRRGYDDPV